MEWIKNMMLPSPGPHITKLKVGSKYKNLKLAIPLDGETLEYGEKFVDKCLRQMGISEEKDRNFINSNMVGTIIFIPEHHPHPTCTFKTSVFAVILSWKLNQ